MRLYWRYKKDGKWTWAPAVVVATRLHHGHEVQLVRLYQEEYE